MSLNKILSLIILVISFCSISFAQESPKNVSKEKILTMLKELKGKKSNEFLEHMQKVQELTQEFVQRKNEECSGNYSSFLLNEEERDALKSKKLSDKEKKLCKYMLINFRIEYVKLLYEARIEYMKELHKHQLKELSLMSEQRIKELQKLAKEYN